MRLHKGFVQGAMCFAMALFVGNEAVAQSGPAVVETKTIVTAVVAPTQATLGTIMPTRRAVIGSAVDGRVVEFLVREGDRVAADQKLASLLTQTIQLELEAAKQELELRQQELTELKNGSLPAEIAQAKARMEAIAVAGEYLEKDKQRLTALGARSAVSVSELEQSLSLWLGTQQKLLEAKAAYQLAVDGPRAEKILQAEARVGIATAVAERLSDQIQKHTLYSRFAGYVTVEHTEVGQWLPRGSPVAEIVALDEVFLTAKVVETQIPFINVGETVQITVPALGQREMSGVVEAIVPAADERSRTFPVKVRIKNEFSNTRVPLLKAGMLAHVVLPIDEKHEALMVPKDALVLNGPVRMIWTIDPKSIEAKGTASEANAIAVRVETGAEMGDLIEVIGELTAGIEVVVRGNERIPPSRPGQPPSRVMWNARPANPTK